MKTIDIITMAFRVLRTYWLRSLLTVAGIAVAIATILLLAGLGTGLQNLTLGSIIQSKSLYSMDVTTNDTNVPPVDLDAISEIQNLPGVSKVSPVYALEGQFEFDGKNASATVKAGSQDFLDMEGIKIISGSKYADSEYQIVISPQTLSLLETTAEKILGQQITLKVVNPSSPSVVMSFDNQFTVIGISDKTDSPANYIPYQLLKKFDSVQPSSIKVMAKDRDGILIAQTAIRTKGYQTDSLIDILDQAKKVFHWMTIALVIIAAIALVVAAIGMFNTLTITLLEQTREIGIMKAVGLGNATVCKLFLFESSILGFIGGILGLGTGLGLSFILEQMVNHLAVANGGVAVNAFQFSASLLAGMVIYPTLLGLLTGIYPAIRASLMNPLKALRYE